jgi:hypothetical protein
LSDGISLALPHDMQSGLVAFITGHLPGPYGSQRFEFASGLAFSTHELEKVVDLIATYEVQKAFLVYMSSIVSGRKDIHDFWNGFCVCSGGHSLVYTDNGQTLPYTSEFCHAKLPFIQSNCKCKECCKDGVPSSFISSFADIPPYLRHHIVSNIEPHHLVTKDINFRNIYKVGDVLDLYSFSLNIDLCDALVQVEGAYMFEFITEAKEMFNIL